MTPLEELLIRHEGLKLFPYADTTGHMTIGVGRNLTDKGISEAEALHLLENDTEEARQDANIIFVNFSDLSENRKMAIIDMIFNIGRRGFLGFKTMIQAIRDQAWDRAADSMLNSLWATQVPHRATELSEMIRRG